MFKKGSKLYSILTGACPKCHKESMYLKKNPYLLRDTLKIHDHCSICKTKYRLDISYLVLESSINAAFLSIIGTLIVFMPIIMRISRNIWINLFMKYDKFLANK
jgi:uncharacterized protein (DUF983 family)